MSKDNTTSDKKKDQWMVTYTGKIVYPYDLKPSQISIRDISHSLARTCRYSGMMGGFYSVAQHSTLISKLVSPKYALTGLLHDAPEAYLRDLPRPVKLHLTGYKDLEEKVWQVIAHKFNLPQKIPKEIKEVDRGIVKAELRDIMNLDEDFFKIQKETPDISIPSISIDQAKFDFMERYLELTEE